MKKAKYYLDENFDPENNSSWTSLLDKFLSVGDAVEFNVLYKNEVLNEILDKYSTELIETGRRRNKIYPSGTFVRFTLSQSIRYFIFSKSYHSWRNFCLEDISILKDGQEILATITHENYIFLIGTPPDQINDINNLGFQFDGPFEWEQN